MVTNHNQSTVESIINETVKTINNEENLLYIDNGVVFENYVFQVMQEIGERHGVPVEQTGAQSFPDIIVADHYGVEVKFTKSKKWQSTGNSIFEGTFVNRVTEQIYMLFGQKDGDQIATRFKYYEDSLSDVKVTHSPRFLIDMDIEKENTIMSKLDTSYQQFRVISPDEKSRYIKEFVSQNLKPGETLWWLDSDEGNDRGKASMPKISELSSVTADFKKRLIYEATILFPEIFSKSQNKYINLAFYLMKEYQIVSSSLRDSFSASGRYKIPWGDHNLIPQTYKKLYENASEIRRVLYDLSSETLKEYWMNHDIYFDESKEREEVWVDLLNRNAAKLPDNVKASDLYFRGLE